MKHSASEPGLRNACFSLKRLSRSSYPAQPGILTLDPLWNAFDADAELFMYKTKSINSYNVFCKQFTEMSIFRLLNLVRLELRSASGSIQLV